MKPFSIFLYIRPFKNPKTMSRGKATCKVLKEMRRKIADANDIPLRDVAVNLLIL